MSKITAINATLGQYASAFNRLAVRNKNFALDLSATGVRTSVNPIMLERAAGDYFEASGKLNESGKIQIGKMLKKFGISKDTSLDEFLNVIYHTPTNPDQMRIFLY